MFYHLKLHTTVDLPPKYFGPKLRETIIDYVKAEAQGKCSRQNGYIICVQSVDDIGQGKIRQDGTGIATFDVTYSAIVMRPFKGEVLDCVVASVNKMGFFADVGPVQVFVSNHLIPDDYTFDATTDPAFVSADQSFRMQEGAEVRVRVVGIKVDANDMFCIATMKEDFLGVMKPAIL